MSTFHIERNAPSKATAIPSIAEPALLTEREAATYLGMSVRTLQDRRVRGGGCPYIKLGMSVRYRRTDLDAWIESNLRHHTSEGR